MPESKIAATDRLRREGRWGAASAFRDEKRREFKAAGMKRGEASEAAWEAMLSEFPPALQSDVALSDADVQLLARRSSSPRNVGDDVDWVQGHLNEEHVPAEAFPSLGAYSLWNWARHHPAMFLEEVWPKVQIVRAAPDKPIEYPPFVLAAFGFEERPSRRQGVLAANLEKATHELAARAMWLLGVLDPGPANDYAEAFGARLHRLTCDLLAVAREP